MRSVLYLIRKLGYSLAKIVPKKDRIYVYSILATIGLIPYFLVVMYITNSSLLKSVYNHAISMEKSMLIAIALGLVSIVFILMRRRLWNLISFLLYVGILAIGLVV